MIIEKFGYGGVYTPGTFSAGTSSTSSGSSSKGTKAETPLKDSLLGLLKDSALPNDHRGTLELAMQVLSNYDLNPGTDISSAEYITLLNAINDGKVNQEVWKKASDYIYSNDTAEEVALDSYGNMFVGKYGDDGQLAIQKISPEDYKKMAEDGWQAVSNAGLLTERANNDTLRWDMSMISGINSSTNASKISKKLQEAINALPETQEGYMLSRNGQLQSILQGAQYAMAEGPDNYYEYSSSTDRPDLSAFYSYAWDYILNENDKAYLRATVAQRGGDPTDAASCFGLITAGTGLYTHFNFDVKSHKDPSGSGGSGSGSGSDGTKIQSALNETYTTGDTAGLPELLTITPQGSGVRLTAMGQNVGPIVTADANNETRTRFGKATLNEVLQHAYGIGRDMISTTSVSFGGQLIDPSQFGGIMYEDTNMYRLYLPVKKVASGDVMPDFEMIDKADQLKEAIQSQNLSTDMINRYLQGICPGAKYNEETNEIEFPPERLQLFLTFGAVASDKYVDLQNSNLIVRDETNASLNSYKKAIEFGSANPIKNAQKRSDSPNKTGHLHFINRLYRGNVFIPIAVTAGSMNSNLGYVPKSTHDNITGRVAEMERQKQVDYYGGSYNW